MVKMKLQDIANFIDAEIVGNIELQITGLNGLEHGKEGDLTFFYNDKYAKYLATTKASAIITSKSVKFEPDKHQALLLVDNPYQSFVKILQWIQSKKIRKSNFIHLSAFIGENCKIDDSVYIGPFCVIGDNCIIGKDSYLHSNITIYDNVEVGENTIVNANSVIYDDSVIGDNCVIHSGVIIGSDGFGYIENPADGSYTKVPQLGNVVIEDNVEIGSNTTIDRAMVGSTYLRKGVKLDNQIQIAHNCDIGENTAMAAQVGVSGSVKVGKRNRFGGQTGISGHLEISDDVILMAKSGVAKSIEKSGVYFGSPIRERMRAFRIEAAIHQLPEMVKDIKLIKQKIETQKES